MASDVSDIIARYEGRVLQTESLCAYDRWALEYFRKPHIIDPHIEVTIQLDITDIAKAYESRGHTPGSSLTAYLTWGLVAALSRHAFFSWRCVDGAWYEFANLPLYFPIATGDKGVLRDIIIDDACRMRWTDFARCYRNKIELARSGVDFQPISDDILRLAWFIGNMPQLQFTSLRGFLHGGRCGAPVFYFGKRYDVGGRMLVPFYASLDHANAEPGRLEVLLGSMRQILMRGETR